MLFLKVMDLGIGYLIVLLITNSYGAAVFGAYTSLVTLISILVLLPRLGLDVAVVRVLGAIEGTWAEGSLLLIRKVFGFLLVSLSLAFLLICFFYQFLSGYFPIEVIGASASDVARLVVLSVLLTVAAAFYQGWQKPAAYIIYNSVLQKTLFLILLIFLVKGGFKLSLMNAYEGSFLVAVFLVLGAISRRVYVTREKKRIVNGYPSLTNLLKLAFPMMMASSFSMIMSWVDIVMLGWMKGAAEVGVYSVAQKIAALTGVSLIAINAIYAPKFAQLYAAGKLDEFQFVVKQSTKFIMLSSLPIVVVFAWMPQQIMGFFGGEFVEGGAVLLLILAGQFVNMMCGSVGYILQMTNNQRIYQRVMFSAAIINIALNYLLVPLYGMHGAAIATLSSLVFWNVTLLIIIYHKFGFITIYIPWFDTGRKKG